MAWSFALIDGKLAEIFWHEGKKPKIWGWSFVKRSEYKTVKERKLIDKDIKKNLFTLKNGKLKPLNQPKGK